MAANEPNLDELLKDIEQQSAQVDHSHGISQEEQGQLEQGISDLHQKIMDQIKQNNQKVQESSEPTLRVLIIDDSLVVRLQIKKLFANYNVVFDEADTGPDAMDYLEFGPTYDLITLDLNLPGLNGLDVLKTVQGHQQVGRFVIISTESENSTITKAISMGVAEYITKPFGRQESSETLWSALSKNGFDPSTYQTS